MATKTAEETPARERMHKLWWALFAQEGAVCRKTPRSSEQATQFLKRATELREGMQRLTSIGVVETLDKKQQAEVEKIEALLE